MYLLWCLLWNKWCLPSHESGHHEAFLKVGISSFCFSIILCLFEFVFKISHMLVFCLSIDTLLMSVSLFQLYWRIYPYISIEFFDTYYCVLDSCLIMVPTIVIRADYLLWTLLDYHFLKILAEFEEENMEKKKENGYGVLDENSFSTHFLSL